MTSVVRLIITAVLFSNAIAIFAFPFDDDCYAQEWEYTKDSSKIKRDSLVSKTHVTWFKLREFTKSSFGFTTAIPVHLCRPELMSCDFADQIVVSHTTAPVSMEVCTTLKNSCKKVKVAFTEDIACHCVDAYDHFEDIDDLPPIGVPPKDLKVKVLGKCGA